MRRAAFLVLIALAFAATLSNPVAADGPPQITFAPASTTAAVGDRIAIDVTVAKVAEDPGLASYDLVLEYDAQVVRLESFEDAGFVSGGEFVVICVTGKIDHAAGSVNATCSAVPLFGVLGVSTVEAKPLLRASFVATAPGTSELSIMGSLVGADDQPMGAEFEAGQVLVEGVADSETPMVDVDDLPAAGSRGSAASSSDLWIVSMALLVGGGLVVVTGLAWLRSNR